jgi:hypothetical protein
MGKPVRYKDFRYLYVGKNGRSRTSGRPCEVDCVVIQNLVTGFSCEVKDFMVADENSVVSSVVKKKNQ